jgi:hypothetical protein
LFANLEFMKIRLILISLFISTIASAQVWIDTGAVWRYNIHVVPFTGIQQFEYTQNVMKGGQMCQEITSEMTLWGSNQFGQQYVHSNYTLTSNYTYSSGDTVFYWSESDSQFFTLYSFAANIGDQWQIGGVESWTGVVCHDSSYVEVIDTGSIFINFLTLRTITLRPTDSSSLGLWGTYAERIGFLGDGSYDYGSLFPYQKGCDSGTPYEYPGMWLNCFEDESFSVYNPGVQPCEHLGIEQFENAENFSIFPNPALDQISLNTIETGSIEIIDLRGKLVFRQKYSPQDIIDVSSLNSGLYFVNYQSESGKSYIAKLIVK